MRKVMGCLHDPANVQQTSSKCIQNTLANAGRLLLYVIYVKKNCSVYIQCKGDIVVVDVKQHKSQFNYLNFTITQSAKFF